MDTTAAKKAVLTPTVFKLVDAWLMAKAYAELMRAKVDAIYKDILEEMPAYVTLEHRRAANYGERIYNVKELYLCTDDELCKRIYAEANRRERAAGLKPDSMLDDYCPALVAESDLRTIEREIIKAAGGPLGVTLDNVFLVPDGWDRFVNLVVGAIVHHPNFINPLETL